MIDLRSDTVTKPKRMLQAMYEAEVGDVFMERTLLLEKSSQNSWVKIELF